MDLERIEALIELLKRHEVREFAYQDDEHQLRLKLGEDQPQPVRAQAEPAEVTPILENGAADASVVQASPMVGTFYRSPSPGAPPFAEVGSVVRPGQPVCIVEAMKLMNEIEAEVGGTVVEVVAQDGEPVQFGQPLLRIRPS